MNDEGEDNGQAFLDYEYQAYRHAADNAFGDSVRAYENMDKWMLTLAGGAFALSAALASSTKGVPLLFFFGTCCFAISVCILLVSKYRSYIICESSASEIENIYKSWPTQFSRIYHEIGSADATRFNQWNETKNRYALWSLVVGIILMVLSLAPAFQSTAEGKSENAAASVRTTEANSTLPTASTAAKAWP